MMDGVQGSFAVVVRADGIERLRWGCVRIRPNWRR